MTRPCEYCGAELPENVDKRSRRARTFHFQTCPARPKPEPAPEIVSAIDTIDAAVRALEHDADWRVRQEAADGLRKLRERLEAA